MASRSKLRLLLANERGKEIATERDNQIKRDRHITRRKTQRYAKLDADGQGHLKHSGIWNPPEALAIGYFRKSTPIDLAVAKEMGSWNGYVYGMKWAVVKFVSMWYILCIGLY